MYIPPVSELLQVLPFLFGLYRGSNPKAWSDQGQFFGNQADTAL